MELKILALRKGYRPKTCSGRLLQRSWTLYIRRSCFFAIVSLQELFGEGPISFQGFINRFYIVLFS